MPGNEYGGNNSTSPKMREVVDFRKSGHIWVPALTCGFVHAKQRL